jgi:hypothetical protein
MAPMKSAVKSALGVLVLAAYAWESAGVRPFTATSYVLVAIPVVAFIAAYAWLGGLSRRDVEVNAYYQAESDGTTLSDVAPWLALVSAAIVLEIIGLALGGRSPRVPTLSTTTDNLLRSQWERSVICFIWLMIVAVPLSRLHRLKVRTR